MSKNSGCSSLVVVRFIASLAPLIASSSQYSISVFIFDDTICYTPLLTECIQAYLIFMIYWNNSFLRFTCLIFFTSVSKAYSSHRLTIWMRPVLLKTLQSGSSTLLYILLTLLSYFFSLIEKAIVDRKLREYNKPMNTLSYAASDDLSRSAI